VQLLIGLGIVVAAYFIWKYWTLWIGAGYDPAPMDKVHKMLNLAEVDGEDTIYDLGCGDGRILITAAREYGARAVGIEIDPLRFFFAWVARSFSGQTHRIKLEYGNFFKKDLSDATVVTLFLYGPTNNRLKEKFACELKPGTRVVSYIWRFEGWRIVDFLPEDRIYLYHI
jgi:SAM-dependent methyltransferase